MEPYICVINPAGKGVGLCYSRSEEDNIILAGDLRVKIFRCILQHVTARGFREQNFRPLSQGPLRESRADALSISSNHRFSTSTVAASFETADGITIIYSDASGDIM